MRVATGICNNQGSLKFIIASVQGPDYYIMARFVAHTVQALASNAGINKRIYWLHLMVKHTVLSCTGIPCLQ